MKGGCLYLLIIGAIFSCFHTLSNDRKAFSIPEIEKQLYALIQQYEDKLGFYKNPFLLAFTMDEAHAVYNSLLWRSEDFFCTESSLFKIQEALKQVSKIHDPDLALVRDVMGEAYALLFSLDPPSLQDLQSNMLALKTAIDYLHHFRQAEIPQEAEQQKKETNEDEKDQTPPEYPDSGDVYKPHTKSLTSSSKNNDKVRIAEVDVKVPFLKQITYSHISRHSDTPLRVSERLLKKEDFLSAAKDKTLIIKPLGKKGQTLFASGLYSC